jgi:S-formylglutathione hydrolase FrmB
LILPERFDEDTGATWPVLYMLHGATSSPNDWREIEASDAFKQTSDFLVVLPDAGRFGFYSDWWNGGRGGQPAWETFHLTEVPALLERDWRASDRRAALGVSMGGYGAFEYATRQPGFFKAVASVSGLVSPTTDTDQTISTLRALGADPDALWGDPVADAGIWAAHDPLRNAAALEGTALFLSYGNGEPGSLDGEDVRYDWIEAWVKTENDAMVQELQRLGIDATVDAYGAGTHSAPYFVREFERAIPTLSAALQEEPAPGND